MATIHSETLSFGLVHREQAAQAFMACAGLDPEGLDGHLVAADRGLCFRFTTPTGEVTYSAGFLNGCLWCYAAAGSGTGMAEALHAVLESQARATGCQAVGFQTKRRGLIRIAQRLGYSVRCRIGTGFVLEKAMA